MYRPDGGMAVMAARQSDSRALDLFPTPPWSTRSLIVDVIGSDRFARAVVWEPAAGLGTMSEVLAEFAPVVIQSDVHDYGKGHLIGSFVGEGADVIHIEPQPDWIITNPPFNLALEFAERAIQEAHIGVALLVRSVWAEGGGRYRRLFSKSPPSIIAQFCERVPMVAGRWNPKATTATSYAWFIWRIENPNRPSVTTTEFRWIPPGARERHTRPDDIARFATAAFHNLGAE